MADEPKGSKVRQLSLEEYNKVKEKRAQSKLRLYFPWQVKVFFIFPVAYFVFLVVFYLMHLARVAEH